MDYLEKARRVLDVEIFELQRLRDRLDDNFSRAVDLIKGVRGSARAKSSSWASGNQATSETRSPPR